MHRGSGGDGEEASEQPLLLVGGPSPLAHPLGKAESSKGLTWDPLPFALLTQEDYAPSALKSASDTALGAVSSSTETLLVQGPQVA